MKRNILVVSLVLMVGLLSLTACGANNEASKTSNDSIGLSTDAALTETVDTSADVSSEQQTNTQQANDQLSSNGNGATILAQSNNAITDTEKQKILTELNTKIDSLINSINALDDVQESDLTFE